jgi:DNA-binding NtrC family response regulator
MDKTVLIVEDEFIVADDLQLTLQQAGYETIGIASSVNRALEIIEKKRPSFVLIDIFLKGNLSGIDLAHILNKKNIPFIFVSANYNPETLALAKSTYPYGFIVKPFKEKDLLVTLDIALYHYENKRKAIDTTIKLSSSKINSFSPQQEPNAGYRNSEEFEGIVGKSKAMLELFDLIRQVAPLDTSVLILGESGTGKEAIASTIHRLSNRSKQALVKINCTTLPADLVESELFGHEKGAFTNAYETKIGKFERANGGTVFLDEIGELSIDIQSKLLRVLQEREIERVGAMETRKVDVRIIAATNKNLDAMIVNGAFRLDLYYRLNVFPIDVPPLRARVGDISLLAKHFIDIYSRNANKPPVSISENALKELENYGWPGNVRELQNIIERTVLLNKDAVIDTIKIPGSFKNMANEIGANEEISSIPEAERQHILKVLQQCNNRVIGPGGAAEMLNIPPSTLYSKMKRLGLNKHRY